MPLPPHDDIELPLLREILTAGGEAKPAYIYPRLRQYFPGITDGDLQATLPGSGANRWTNRVRWTRQYLVRKGELFREPRGLWRITPKGKARVESVPIPHHGGDPVEEKATPTADQAEKQPVVMVADHVEQLCESLLKAQQQSSAPKNLEIALAQAFRFLGFEVDEQGKAGETDVLLDTHIGPDSYRVVVDAKATHGSKVADSQINWLAINQHQQQAQAQHAAVVGIDFAGGNLLKWARQYKVALIRTSDLTDVLRRHRQAPFSLVELLPLFATPGPTQQSVQDLKSVFDGRIRHWLLLRDIVERIDSYNRFSKPGLGISADGIQFALHQKIVNQPSVSQPHSHVPSIDEVRDAMALLASRGIGILREEPAGSGKYYLTIHLDGAIKRIVALAREIEQVDLTATSIAATGSLKKI